MLDYLRWLWYAGFTMKRKPFKIDEKLIDKVRARGKRTGQSIAWQIEKAVKDFLNKEK